MNRGDSIQKENEQLPGVPIQGRLGNELGSCGGVAPRNIRRIPSKEAFVWSSCSTAIFKDLEMWPRNYKMDHAQHKLLVQLCTTSLGPALKLLCYAYFESWGLWRGFIIWIIQNKPHSVHPCITAPWNLGCARI